MDKQEKAFINKLKMYRRMNSFIMPLARNRLMKVLVAIKVPPHTIGVFFNPSTSPQEQFGIIRYFAHKNDYKIKDLLKVFFS